MWKNVVRAGQATSDIIIRRMRIACWINKATDTHSEYVIVRAFPRHHRLREITSLSRYTYIALSWLLFQVMFHSLVSGVSRWMLQNKIKSPRKWRWHIFTKSGKKRLHIVNVVRPSCNKLPFIKYSISSSSHAFKRRKLLYICMYVNAYYVGRK